MNVTDHWAIGYALRSLVAAMSLFTERWDCPRCHGGDGSTCLECYDECEDVIVGDRVLYKLAVKP